MGYEYALVHLTYTIPPAIILTILYYPLFTRLDLYKILFLITIAVVSTIPWDSYLIRTGVWSYPPRVIIGPTLFSIPLEEVFFFVIQTYDTALLYLILSKPVLKEAYLVCEHRSNPRTRGWRFTRIAGQVVLALGIRAGAQFIQARGENTYLGLILVWALPFLLLLWSLAYQFIVGLPLIATFWPIAIPTFYLWIVDTLALQRGTWVISTGTKTGYHLWPTLEIEEAIFFLLTNMLIVFGMLAFDNALAVLYVLPAHFPRVPELPSPVLLVKALLLPSASYDADRIIGLKQASDVLARKSRSFSLAAATFPGRLRLDLIRLYSFCRVADDLVDTAPNPATARVWVAKLRRFLALRYDTTPDLDAKGELIDPTDPNRGKATLYVVKEFPPEAQLSLLLLPTAHLDREPLDELLRGFDMDLVFTSPQASSTTGSNARSAKQSSTTSEYSTPISSLRALDLYSARVAGTVALMVIQLTLFHYGHASAIMTPAGKTKAAEEIPPAAVEEAKRLMSAGHDMGIALQYTNIARDLGVDAANGRCYVPPEWLDEVGLSTGPKALIEGLSRAAPDKQADGEAGSAFASKVSTLRAHLLDRAFAFYGRSVSSIENLPRPARAPMRVAVESYMQIARELKRPGFQVKKGRATVPVLRRILVAWRAMLGPKRQTTPSQQPKKSDKK